MKVLIVEDDPLQAAQLAQPFDQQHLSLAGSLESAVAGLRESWPDVVILDAVFPLRSDGSHRQIAVFNAARFLDILDEISDSAERPRPDVILVSSADEAAGEMLAVGEWLRSGRVLDVVPKGSNWRVFLAVLEYKLDETRRRRKLRPIVAAASSAFASLRSHGIITEHPAMARVWKLISNAARSGFNTFVHGETGSGKELVAKAIALPDTLFESEIFGVAPGAFTGALARAGYIEVAGSGVLFLDEICSVPRSVQARLRGPVEPDTRSYFRIGETVPRPAKCMFVFGDTQHPLEACVEKNGKVLDPELANRMATIRIRVPPLRDRAEDIPLLIGQFLDEANRELGRSVELAPRVREAFERGSWRAGNVRALKQVIRQIAASAPDRVSWQDIVELFDEPIERRFLEEQLDAPLDAGPGWRPAAPAEDVETTLIRLRSEINEEQPLTWWRLLAKNRTGIGEGTLERALLHEASEPAPEGIATILRQVSARDRKDPADHLFHGALLYLLLQPEHQASRSDFMRVLHRSYAQVEKVESALLELGGDLITVEEGHKNRRVLLLRTDGWVAGAAAGV